MTEICLFSSIMLLGGGPLILSLILGEIFDFADGVFEGLDNFLEGFGIDLFPDEQIGEGRSGFGTTTVLAFLTLFGGGGLVASVSFNAGPVVSTLVGLVSGVVAAALMMRFMVLMYRQQASSHLTENDFLNVVGQISGAIPENGVGRVTLTVKGQIVRLSARTDDNSSLKEGSSVVVIRKEGTVAIVRKQG